MQRELRIRQRLHRPLFAQVLLILFAGLVLLCVVTLHSQAYCTLILATPPASRAATCVPDNRPAVNTEVHRAKATIPAGGERPRPAVVSHVPAERLLPAAVEQG